MSNFLDDFFSSYSEGIEKKRIENLKRINNCYEIANSLKDSLFEQFLRVSAPTRKFQNPVIHSRVDFKGTSSLESLKTDILDLCEEGKVDLKNKSSLVEEFRFYLSFETPGWVSFPDSSDYVVIEGTIPVSGYVSINIYSYPETSVIKSSLNDQILDSVFMVNGEIRSKYFTFLDDGVYVCGDFKIHYDEGLGISEIEI